MSFKFVFTLLLIIIIEKNIFDTRGCLLGELHTTSTAHTMKDTSCNERGKLTN